MSKRQYVRAGVIQGFLGSNRYVARASMNLVVSPRVFLHRVRNNPCGRLVSVEYIVSREVGCVPMNVEDFMADKLPSNTKFVSLKFATRGSLYGCNFLVSVSLRTGYAEIIGETRERIELLDWLNVPFSDFVFIAPSSEPVPCGIFD